MEKRTERHLARIALEVCVHDVRYNQTRSDALRGTVRLHGWRNVNITDVDST